jgi:4-hydroxybenzoate polyprenyltransferase
MGFLKNVIPSRSALIHLRFGFSFFLMPVFLFALSQAPLVVPIKAILTFIIWHILVYPASNGFNSYFDKDEGSIALVKVPPKVDKSLYLFSLLLDVLALILSLIVSRTLFIAVLLYGIFSKSYSHPSVRIKKYPLLSFMIVFLFQGACVYWSTYAAVSGLTIFDGWNLNFAIAGMICSCLVGATYPLTQVYQHEEDKKRGDKTLSLVLGIKGSFWFSATLFVAAILLLFEYWTALGVIRNFWWFFVFGGPVILIFANWFIKVMRDSGEANYQNMIRMILVSGTMMLMYFGLLNFI